MATAKMEQLSTELDDLAASLANTPEMRGSGGGESGGEGASGTSDDEQLFSQLSRSFDAEDWGSIADLLKSIESTSQGRPARLSPQHHRLTPLSENIQCSVPPTPPLSPTGTKSDGGQGMQQLDHLLRMMEQMCALQKQNSKLREQAEYLTAIKNLQELRNETLLENCHCDSQHRSMDPCGGVRFEPLQMPEETLSEPESQIGDDMNATRQRRNSRARSINRDAKSRNMKKRSRSADPYGDKEPQRERGRVGIFSKFEKMKEKLTTRRGSVKRHPPKGRVDDEAHRRMELSTDGSMQMDGTETKSEDSGIYHVDPTETMQKSQEDFSDSEEVFSTPPLAPTTWSKPGAFSSEGRKNSDFSTGSSSEDYLELKPKRHTRGADLEGSVVYRRRRKDLSPHRLKNGDMNGENRIKLIRRSASFQDNISLNSDDDYEDAKSQWESKEAPAILQGHTALHQSHSIPIMDSSKHRLYERNESSAQKRKHLHRAHQVDEVDSGCNGEHRPYSADFLSMKNSPPEKKRPKGWEKVKHVVTRKHGPDGGNRKGFSEFYTELSAEDHEALAAAEGAVLLDRSHGSEERIGRPTHKRYKHDRAESAGHSSGSTGTSNTSLAMYETLQANLSDDFTKKMERWDRKKVKKGVQLEKTKQTSLDSASSDATSAVHSPVLDELQKNLSDDFTKKMLEWDRKKQRPGNAAHSPPTEPKRKQRPKEKPKTGRPGSKIIKHKGTVRGKESPQIRRRSQSPEGRKAAPYSTEEIYSKDSMALIEGEDGEFHLEGVSKEFTKRYKEWERIRKMATRHDDDRGDHEMDPKDSRRVALIEQNKSSISDTGDVYLVAHATPVVVEPEFDPANFESQEAGSQAEFTEKSNRTASSTGDESVYGESTPSEASGEQIGAGLNRLEQRNSLLAEQLRKKDVNLQAVSDELHNMQEQIDRITGEKHEMRRVSVCSSLGESALEAELTDIKSQIEILEDDLVKYPPLTRRSHDEVKGHHKRRHGSRGKGDVRAVSVGKVDESTSTDAVPEKIEVEVQTNDPELPPSDDTKQQPNPDSPTTQLKKCLHEREAIIMLLQAEVDRQANELNYLRSGDAAGAFRRAKSFSARDRKTFDMRAMRVVDIPFADKLEDLAEKADEMPELPTKRLDEFAVTLREKSDTLSSRSSQDSKRESLMSVMSAFSSSTTQSLETLHISAEDIRMEESGGSEASDKPKSLRSQASDTSSLETKSEPIRKMSLERKNDRREQERESSPESATSLLRKRCNRDNIEILPSKRDLSSKSDVKTEDGKENNTPSSPSRLNKVSPQIESVKLAKKADSRSADNSPKSPRRLVNVNHSPRSGSPIHVAKKWDNIIDSNKGSSESLGSREGKSLVQERKEMFAIRGRLEKSASLDSSQVIGPHTRRSDTATTFNVKRKLSTDSTSSSPQRRAASQWVEKYDPVLSKSKKPEDKSVNNLRKKFTTMEFGSAPNVSEVGHQSLKDKYTPRARREVPKQGCVRQLSQAFSMVSLIEGDQSRRGSQSSSVKSSPRSLSPASSTNSLIANQIKKLQDKTTNGSSSDVSSRRQSVDVSKSSTRESSPAPISPLVGRREYRQSLPNIAAVRAKFDKAPDKTADISDDKQTDKAADKSVDKATGDSKTVNKDSSVKSDHKPVRAKTAPAARITYKVSVVNDDKEKSTLSSTRSAKEETSARVRSPRLVAVIESPPEKEEEGTVTFTLKPNPSRGRKVNSSTQETSKDTKKSISTTNTSTRRETSRNSNSGNVRRKTQMFTATVEETTTVVKKPKSEEKKEVSKKVTVEVQSMSRKTGTSKTDTPKRDTSKPSAGTRNTLDITATSSVRPKETSKSSDNKSNVREETASARARRRRREQTNASQSPSGDRVGKSLSTPSSNVQGKSPDRRGRRSRNRRDLKTPEAESKKVDNEKQERPSARGARRERRDHNTKTELTETQRKEAIIARRERREAREARDAAKVERKDSKKEKTAEGLERKDSKNTKSDKKVGYVERRDSNKSKRESVKVDRKDSKTKKDVRLQRTESDLKNEKKDTDSPLRSLRRRRSKREELSTPSTEFDSTSEGASGNSEFGDSTSQGSDYPDLLANTRRKKEAVRSDSRSSRCARAVVAHSALKGAEALIGTQLPKASEEDPNERKSRKDKSSRRGRAINRTDRISRLDLFRRARSVDSSKATKDRSPSTERGKSERAQSVDRTSKKRESSMDRQKGGDSKNWLSKRTGSISNFLRASNEADCIDSSCSEDDDNDSSHGNSNCHCHHDSGYHENTCTALHDDSDDEEDSDEWSCDRSCDSMYDKHDEVYDLQVNS